mmetsp:Transcript_292/g.1222  ORF Transcript_292/g.1222 Transcript_292/m.1222 type:complete len:206 (+) Transcript_292:3-620(+)
MRRSRDRPRSRRRHASAGRDVDVRLRIRVARVSRRVPVGRSRSRRGAIAHPANHRRARLHGHLLRCGRGGGRLDGRFPPRGGVRGVPRVHGRRVRGVLPGRAPSQTLRAVRAVHGVARVAGSPLRGVLNAARGVLVAGHAEPDDARQPRGWFERGGFQPAVLPVIRRHLDAPLAKSRRRLGVDAPRVRQPVRRQARVFESGERRV